VLASKQAWDRYCAPWLPAMSLAAIELNTLDELYAFVESSVARTGLVLAPDAFFRPWVRTVSAECHDVQWRYLNRPLSDQLLQHLKNFAHAPVPDKGFVLFENGQVVKVVDVEAVDGTSRPDRLGTIVRQAFASKSRSAGNAQQPGSALDPYHVLGANPSDSEDELKKKYKQAVMQYHPDRVAHLGPDLRELAAKKTTEINAAFSQIRRQRGF
jgi:hypothetical protein